MSSFLRSATTGAIVLLSSFPAFAGDRDHWSGAYMGGQMGTAWNSTSWNWNIPDNAGVGDPTDYLGAVKGTTFAKGIQFGYQQKFGLFVPGIEISYVSQSAKGQSSITDTTDTRVLYGRVGDLFSLTGRLGIAQDRWLGYFKGGLTMGDVDFMTSRASDGAVQTRSSGRYSGFTYGGGLEYALVNNLSLGAEYNFTQLNVSRSGVEDTATTTASSHSSDPTVKSLMFRLNYKFSPALF